MNLRKGYYLQVGCGLFVVHTYLILIRNIDPREDETYITYTSRVLDREPETGPKMCLSATKFLALYPTLVPLSDEKAKCLLVALTDLSSL